MKVLDKDEKKIYDEFINMIQFENIECWNVPTSKSWLNLNVNEDLK